MSAAMMRYGVPCGAVLSGWAAAVTAAGVIGCGSANSAPATPDAGPAHEASTVEAGRPEVSTPAEAAAETGGKADALPDAAEAGPALDHGDASSTYPAFAPDVPSLQSQGGSTLHNPHFVTVTWPGEPNADQFEAFGDDIGPSAYWALTTSEYGVGPGWSSPADHIRLTESPIAAWSDTAFDAWFADHLTNRATYGLPAPDVNTVYTFYLSTATSSNFTLVGANACQQAGGYHQSIIWNGMEVPYAIILQCQGYSLATATQSVSHELIEAATDPHVNDPAYRGFDSDHLAWDIFQQFFDEVGDACEFYYGASGSFYSESFPNVTYVDAGSGDAGDGGAGGDAALLADAGSTMFNVQRTWSNVSATAGHDPCVPTPGTPYYSVSPMNLETIHLNLAGGGGSSNVITKGYSIPPGTTKTFPIAFHSDGPTSGPWTVSAREGNPLTGGVATSHLTVSIDAPTGQNGEIAYVTVTVTSVDTSMYGELITFTSKLGTGSRTYVPILISNQ